MKKEIKTLDEYKELIRGWSEQRGILANGKVLAQITKHMEEGVEILDAYSNQDKDELIDAIGDSFVTLNNIAFTAGLDINECVEHAWNQIRNRTGYLRPDGVFVKDNDKAKSGESWASGAYDSIDHLLPVNPEGGD